MESLEQQISELLNGGGVEYLSIEAPNSEAIIQVCRAGYNGLNAQVNIGYYPSSDAPATALGAVGINIPAGWSLVEFEEDVYAVFDVPEPDAVEVAGFVTAVFERFFRSEIAPLITAG